MAVENPIQFIEGGEFEGLVTPASLSDLTDVVISSPANDQVLTYDATLEKWINKVSAGGAVFSVNTKTGVVVLNKGDIGLGDVDNTADSAKPVSTAQATAIGLKANTASPTLTGSPASTTPTAGDNSTRIATTAFVVLAIAAAMPVTFVSETEPTDPGVKNGDWWFQPEE